MTKDIKQQLEDQYQALQEKINEFAAGECKAADVKKLSSYLGIYGERDNNFMLRVRRAAGETSVQNLRDIADVMEANNIDHGHFSTRQNIQFHGVPGENVYKTIKGFCERDMEFRGGGGNTFRNLATSPYTGVSTTETFDTFPHTQAVWKWVYFYEKAYNFGRKFKLGFTSEEKDDSNAGIQDLGFVAKIVDGQRGFKVYGGGGMGRGGSLGVVLFDFLPEKDVNRASQAMIDLFYDHGDRKVRGKARLRFVCQRLGEEEFVKLYMEYYKKTDAPDLVIEERDYTPFAQGLKTFSDEAPADENYEGWVKRAVKETKFDDVVSVRLFIRRGNFKADDFRRFADILDGLGTPFIRVTIEQDGIIPLVHMSALPYLYKALNEKLTEQSVTDGRFDNHIVACIGAALCPIGVLRSPEAALTVADSLDDLFDEYNDVRSETYEGVIDGINISGCPSSCGLNQVSGIGFNGMKKKIDDVLTDVYQVWVGGEINESHHYLAKTDASWIVKATEIGDFVAAIVKEYLEEFKGGSKQSLKAFMIGKRDSFKVEDYI